jgi:hypothetical protein
MTQHATDFVCLEYDEGYFCNLLPKHEGEHEAWACNPAEPEARYVAHRWPPHPSGKPAVKSLPPVPSEPKT